MLFWGPVTNPSIRRTSRTSSRWSSTRKVEIQIILSYLIVLFFWVHGSIIQTIQKWKRFYLKFLASKFQNISIGNFKIPEVLVCLRVILISGGSKLLHCLNFNKILQQLQSHFKTLYVDVYFVDLLLILKVNKEYCL